MNAHRFGQFILPVFLALVGAAAGCKRTSTMSGQGPIVLYCSVDDPYARPIIQQFTQRTGIQVTLLTDAEATKSVGLAERLRAERDHPQADVWWSNECCLTINLGRDGVLAPYRSPAAADIPAQYRNSADLWAASVLRVRTLVSRGPGVTRLHDLLAPEVRGKIALARPTAGTTGEHLAALYTVWGPQKTEAFLHALHDNGVSLVGGNSVVAEMVARGQMDIGLCDNDDAADAGTNIGKLNAALPDQGADETGTLAIPCAVALIKNGPHPQAAQKLIDYLLSPEVDKALLDAHFAWSSTRNADKTGKYMKVDFNNVAQAMPAAVRSATAILEGR